MDEFEAKYVKGEGRTYFRDKVPVPRWFLPLSAAGALAMVIAYGAATSDWGLAAALGVGAGSFGFVANLALLGLRMVVSDGGVDVWVGARRHHVDVGEIDGTEVAEFRFRDYPVGRGHVRRGLGGKAFIGSLGMPGAADRGVRVRLRNGSSVFLTTNRPEELRDAIEVACGREIRTTTTAERDAPVRERSAETEPAAEAAPKPAEQDAASPPAAEEEEEELVEVEAASSGASRSRA
jgi:hypothetical protein